jgi:putative copper export protein
VRRLALVATGVALAGTIAWGSLEALDGGATWTASSVAVLTVARGLLLVVALATGLVWPAVAASAVGLSLVTLTAGGHSSGDPLAMLLLAAHLGVAVVWLGSAPAVLLTLRSPQLTDAEVTDVVRRFSRLAGFALMAIAAAGAALTWNLSDGLAGGLASPWVVTLGGKLALVAGAALLGFAGRRHLRGRPDRRQLTRLFLVDAAVLVGVAVLSSLLTLTSPHTGHAGHEAGGDSRCVATVGDRSVSVIATPGQVGTNEILVGGVPADVLSVTLQWVHDLTQGGAITMATAPAASTWTAAGALPLAGPWEVSVDVRIDTFTLETGSCTLTIAG